MKGKEKIKQIFHSDDAFNKTLAVVGVGVIILSLVIMLLLPLSFNPINRRGATIRSNSMDPTFSRGDVVFLEEADTDNVEEGDVIAFSVPERWQREYGYPELVVHRVTEVVEDEDTGQVSFRTQGDADDKEDPFLTPSQNVIGEYSGTRIPYIGLIFLFGNTLEGMVTFLIAFILLVIGFYFPWHIDKKEEQSETINRLGNGIDTLENGLGKIERAVAPSGENIVIKRESGKGTRASIKEKDLGESKTEEIMVTKSRKEKENEIPTFEIERESKDNINKRNDKDMRPLGELDKEFQRGELTVDEFIEKRKEFRGGED